MVENNKKYIQYTIFRGRWGSIGPPTFFITDRNVTKLT